MILQIVRATIILLTLAVVALAQDIPSSQPPIWAAKPDVTLFEKVENDRLDSAQKSIAQLVSAKGSRNVQNTVQIYDEALRELNSAGYFAGMMQQVHPDAAFRDHATAMFRKVSQAVTNLSLNQDVYKALSTVDVSHADAATQYYVKRQLLEFRLAGVDKDEVARD